jgi:hypothetical protein
LAGKAERCATKISQPSHEETAVNSPAQPLTPLVFQLHPLNMWINAGWSTVSKRQSGKAKCGPLPSQSGHRASTLHNQHGSK